MEKEKRLTEIIMKRNEEKRMEPFSKELKLLLFLLKEKTDENIFVEEYRNLERYRLGVVHTVNITPSCLFSYL